MEKTALVLTVSWLWLCICSLGVQCGECAENQSMCSLIAILLAILNFDAGPSLNFELVYGVGIGGGLGFILFCVCLPCCIFCYCYRRQKKRRSRHHQSSDTSTPSRSTTDVASSDEFVFDLRTESTHPSTSTMTHTPSAPSTEEPSQENSTATHTSSGPSTEEPSQDTTEFTELYLDIGDSPYDTETDGGDL